MLRLLDLLPAKVVKEGEEEVEAVEEVAAAVGGELKLNPPKAKGGSGSAIT